MVDSPNERSPDYELLRFRLLSEMQAELTAWAKRRFSILAIVVAVVGTFGFTTVLTQIIQGLVSSNVKSSVDNEIKNLKTAVDRELEYARDIVDQQLSRLDQSFDRTATRLDNTIERATKKELILEHATVEAQRRAEEARGSVITAVEQLKETREAIKLATQDAQKLKNDYQNLKENYGRFGEDISSRVSRFEALSARSQKQMTGLEDRLRIIEATVSGTLEIISQDDAKLTNIVASYSQYQDKVEHSYSGILDLFDYNSRSKVVIFVQRGGGLVENAEILASKLRSEGFESEVWITDSEEPVSALSDIAAYFDGIHGLLSENKSGFVYAKEDDRRVPVIAGILSNSEEFRGLAPLNTDFSPTQTIRRNLKGESLSSSNLYLIYKTAE